MAKIGLSQASDAQEVDVSQSTDAQEVGVSQEPNVQGIGVSQRSGVQPLSLAQQGRDQRVGFKNDAKFMRGEPGVSPTIEAEPVSGGHNLIITDIDGTEIVFVKDGVTEEIPVSFIEAL